MEMKRMSFFDMKPFNAGWRERAYREITVTIKENSVNISVMAFEAMGKPKYVEVGFNESKHIFGVKPVDVETKYSIRLTSGKNNKSNWQIPRTAVCEKIEELLPFGRKDNNLIISDGQFDEESGYWLFDIDSGQIVKRVKRK